MNDIDMSEISFMRDDGEDGMELTFPGDEGAKMDYLKPQIGYYQAECCLLDLYKIETQEDLDDAIARVEDNDECGPLMVFATLAEAIAYLRGNASGLTPQEEAAEFARLGWVDA
jgi:hypothetical protein